MLLLHECASMPDCPAERCCSPNQPTQEVYKAARDDAYRAYHNIRHDTELAKKAYLDLIASVSSGKHRPHKRPTRMPTGTYQTTPPSRSSAVTTTGAAAA